MRLVEIELHEVFLVLIRFSVRILAGLDFGAEVPAFRTPFWAPLVPDLLLLPERVSLDLQHRPVPSGAGLRIRIRAESASEECAHKAKTPFDDLGGGEY